jgi:Flp pilus assembly protein TadG
MIRALRLLANNTHAAAAAEMALVLPLLLIILFGSVELGNYFMNEHSLIKSVRDGARFAARQNFSLYPDCSTVDSSVVTETQNVESYGYLSGGNVLTPNISASDIAVSTGCATAASGETMLGIYRGRSTGAQMVTVTASVPYRPILSAFGFTGLGLNLNASSQAVVTGI